MGVAMVVFGTAGLVASLLLNLSPTQDVLDLHRIGNVMERRITPFCMMIIDGTNWVVYGIMIDDMYPVVITNLLGGTAGLVYALTYLHHVQNDPRDEVRRRAIATFVGSAVIIMLVVLHSIVISNIYSTEASAEITGILTSMFNMLLYSSPLELASKVITTKSTSGMYLPLSVNIVVASSMWTSYGVLLQNWFIVVPQSVGLFAGVLQLLLFIRYGVADNNQALEPIEGQDYHLPPPRLPGQALRSRGGEGYEHVNRGISAKEVADHSLGKGETLHEPLIVGGGGGHSKAKARGHG
ncbi:unnamed protein product [Discosporangium mesarthrocarpum]